MARVAILGIPISHVRYSVVDDEALCVVDIKYQNRNTDKQRKDLENLLSAVSNGIKVVDLGELPHPDSSKIDYSKLAESAKKILQNAPADVIITVGHDHSAAFPLYAIPGNVLRLDAHGDAYMFKDADFTNFVISGANYMHYVAKQNLKRPEEVMNLGITPENISTQYHGDGFFGSPVNLEDIAGIAKTKSVNLLDIDVDVLHRSFALPHSFRTSSLTPADLADIIRATSPRIVGLFELVVSNGAPYQDVFQRRDLFAPLCEAVAQTAIARSRSSPQNPQASFVAYP